MTEDYFMEIQSIITMFKNADDDAVFNEDIIATVLGIGVGILKKARTFNAGIKPYDIINDVIRFRKSDVVKWIKAHPDFVSSKDYIMSFITNRNHYLDI